MIPSHLIALAQVVAQQAAPVREVHEAGPTVGSMPLLAQSVMAWLAFLAAILALTDRIWKGGKYVQKLDESEGRMKETIDGWGARVKKIEEAQQRAESRENEWLRAMDALTQANHALSERIGEAKRASEQSATDTETFAINVGSKIDSLARDIRTELSSLKESVNLDARQTGERLKGVEKQVEMMMPYMPKPNHLR